MTRLAISNIAWAPAERDAALAIVAESGARGIEVAPGLAFPNEVDPFEPSPVAEAEFRRALDRHGLQLVSMQSLLFGVQGAKLFGDAAERERFEHGIGRAIGLAGRLGIPNLVLGSPANRVIPDDMDHASATRIAVDSFRRLGDLCVRNGAVLALEPNPSAYGTNFMNRVEDASAIALLADHPAVRVNFDLGSLHMNDEVERTGELFGTMAAHVSHVHLSEPNLAEVPADPTVLSAAVAAIAQVGFGGWYSIEMRAGGADNLGRVRRSALACATALRQSDPQAAAR